MDVLQQEGLHFAMVIGFKRVVPLISKWLIIFKNKIKLVQFLSLIYSSTFDVLDINNR